jgi:hypothetical protein
VPGSNCGSTAPSGRRRPDLAGELAAQLEILAVRGGERALQVLGLDAMALLELSDLRRERAHHVALRRRLIALGLPLRPDSRRSLLVRAQMLDEGAQPRAV